MCLLPADLPKCQPLCLDSRTAFMSPLSPSGLLKLPAAGTRSVYLSHEGLTCLPQGSQGAGQLLLTSSRRLSPGACSLSQLLFLHFMSEAETRNRNGSQLVSAEYLRVKDFLFCSIRRVGADELCVYICMCVPDLVKRLIQSNNSLGQGHNRF